MADYNALVPWYIDNITSSRTLWGRERRRQDRNGRETSCRGATKTERQPDGAISVTRLGAAGIYGR